MNDNDFYSRVRRDTRIVYEEEESDDARNEVSTASKPIEVESVNFNVKEQAKKHNTDRFSLVNGNRPVPVLRRGTSFFIDVRFKRPYVVGQDRLQVTLTFGETGILYRGSYVNLVVTTKTAFDHDASRWDVFMVRQAENEIRLWLQIPTLEKVGIWRLKIVSVVSDYSRLSRVPPFRVYDFPENIYILFNPWSPDDPVYMDDEKRLREYVLNDGGKLYYGTYKYPGGRPWSFGQFDSVVLPASMFLLQKSRLHFKTRGDPVRVVRALSAIINSNDDNGVVHGRWSEPYDDGKHPTEWAGSVAILKQYMETAGRPVKYGQCWVYSGVFTTVCRALGIPCRSITNFSSAHDRDGNVDLDMYFDTTGNPLDYMSDSMWNFHVWNECWMTRPDLPQTYGGWQVVDATPQEPSEGIYQSGPASVLAVRTGQIHYKYDSSFVFSEVDADYLTWQQDPKSETGFKLLSVDTTRVGRLIVTKKMGYQGRGIEDMEDITSEYKAKEGSAEEAMIVSRKSRDFEVPLPSPDDIEFVLQDIDKAMIGETIHMVLKMHNKTPAKKTVTSVLNCSSVYYTGVRAKEVKKGEGVFVLQPNQSEQIAIDLDFDEYFDKLVDFAMLKIHALGTVQETNQAWASEDDFRIEKPSLLLEVEGTVKKNQPFHLKISFTNPLKRRLQECVLSIEAPDIDRRVIKLRDGPPGGRVMHRERLTLTKSGSEQIIAVFNSTQLVDIFGSETVVVED